MSFTHILEELETLQKSMKKQPMVDDDPDAGDEQIAEAAPANAMAREEQDRLTEKKKKAEDEKDEGEEKDEKDEDEKDEDEDEEKGEMFGKSFSITLEDGTETEAYDATLIMKSFDERISATEKLVAVIAGLQTEIESLRASLQENSMQKALAIQTDLLKSLAEQVGSLRKEGTGRKSVLNVHEKPPMAGTIQPPMTPSNDELLNKAEIAQRQGRISALDVSRIETYLGRGLQVPTELTRHLV